MNKTESPAINNGSAITRLIGFQETFVLERTFLLRMIPTAIRISAENPPHYQAAKRYK